MAKNPIIRSFFAKNGLTIAIIIIFVSFVIFAVQGLNYLTENKKLNNNRNINISKVEKNVHTAKNTVYEFLNYCNEKNVSSANALLTLECKEKYDEWLKEYFANSKTYMICSELMQGNIYDYKIEIMDNVLETGQFDNNLQEVEIKVKEENNEYKIII